MSNGGQVPGAILPNGGGVQAPQVPQMSQMSQVPQGMPQGMQSFGNAATAGMANASPLLAMGARAAQPTLGRPVNAPVMTGANLFGSNNAISGQALQMLQQQIMAQIAGAAGGLPKFQPQGSPQPQPASSDNGIPSGMPLNVANTLATVYGSPQAGLQGLQAQFPGVTPQNAGSYTNWLTNAPQGGNN